MLEKNSVVLDEEFKPKTVSDYLNEVDYKSLEHYSPSHETLKYINFIRLVDEQLENKTPNVHLYALDRVFKDKNPAAIMCHRGFSKCLIETTRVMTPEGFTLLRDIKEGDIVIDRHGYETKVTHVSKTFHNKKCYKIRFDDNNSIIASYDHTHIVMKDTELGYKECEMTTEELVREYNKTKLYIPIVSRAVKYKPSPVELDPYTIGLLLCSSSRNSLEITCSNRDIYDLLEHIPYNTSVSTSIKHVNTIRLIVNNDLKREIEGIFKTNCLPHSYLFNTVDVRVNVLCGILDSVGKINNDGSITINTTKYSVVKVASSILRGLGCIVRLTTTKDSISSRYSLEITNITNFVPFKLRRNIEVFCSRNKQSSFPYVGIKRIYEHSPVPTKCITVDSPTHSYVIEDGYITHNTTIYAEFLILYVASFGVLPMKDFGKVNFMIYIGDSIENGVKSLRKNIEFRYSNSKYLQDLIPNMAIKYSDDEGVDTDGELSAGRKFTDVRLEFVNKRGDHLVVRMFGAKTGVRGCKELGKRPEVAIIDDIISDEDARSSTVISSIESTIHNAVKYALNPNKQKIIWMGTPFNSKDPLYKAVESGAYNVACFPVCEKFPCKKEEFSGSWEDRFSYEYVQSAYMSAVRLGKLESFNQEMMLRITSKEDRLIEDSDFIKFKKLEVLKDKDKYNYYITTDLATSESKHADYSVISVWAINNNNDYMLVDGTCKRCLVDEFISDLFRLVSIYKPLGVGIEVTGQQAGFISWIQSEMIAKNIFFTLLSSDNNKGKVGIRPVADKFSRFMMFLPRIKMKKVWIATEMLDTDWGKEFIDEYSKASKKGFKSKHDDVLDTLSMLGSFTVIAPEIAPIYTTKEEQELFNPDPSMYSLKSGIIF